MATATASTPALKPLFLADADAAKLIGIGRSKFLQMHREGLVPKPQRFGRRIVWSLAELEEWARSGCPSRA